MFVVFSIVGFGVIAALFWDRRKLKRDMDALQSALTNLNTDRNHDALTGLFSRSYMEKVYAKDNAHSTTYLAVLDIDQFRSINQRFDMETGDAFLREYGAFCRAFLPEAVTMARLGRDRFLIDLCTYSENCASDLAQGLLKALHFKTFKIGDHELKRTGSIGIAFKPERADFSTSARLAENALEHAKLAGGNNLQLADANFMNSVMRKRSSINVDDLRASMKNGELSYHVQPIFNIKSRMVTGVEALIRWQLPCGATRQPSEFIDLLAEAERISLRPHVTAARNVAEAFAALHPQMFCSFNISSTFLENQGVIDQKWLDNLLQNLPPHQIVLELVEDAVIANPEAAKQMVKDLRARGVRVALDDFGTGHSNLERLREYPVDIVKLDKQFVANLAHNPRDLGIVMGLVQMAKTMGFDIIAEGIETEEQLEYIASTGIELAQGFLLGRPEPRHYWQERLMSDPTFQLLQTSSST